jgi:hypothetical protein
MNHKGGLVMKKIVITVLFALALPATSFAADTMRDGYWELTSTMEMPGMPMTMPPTTIKHCYTKEDVKDQKKTITTDKNCTVTDLKQSGNKVTWKMKCTGKNAGDFSGETVYTRDAYDSTMKMESQGRTMTMKVKAKRLGNCP